MNTTDVLSNSIYSISDNSKKSIDSISNKSNKSNSSNKSEKSIILDNLNYIYDKNILSIINYGMLITYIFNK